MIGPITLNSFLGFAIGLAFLFCIGDANNAMTSKTGYDFIEVFFQVAKSHAGASAMAAVSIALVVCPSVGFLASASRFTCWIL